VALGVAEVGTQTDRDQRRIAIREQVGEAGLRGAGRLAGVEDDLADEQRIVDLRKSGDAVLRRGLQQALLELLAYLLGRRVCRLPLLCLRQTLRGCDLRSGAGSGQGACLR